MNRRLLFRALLLSLLSSLCAATASFDAAAQATPGTKRATARVRAKLVDGRIVVRCQLRSHASTMAAYLFLAYDRMCGVELHNQATDALKIEFRGQRKPFELAFPGLSIDIAAREHGDEDQLRDFTKLHASALEEIGVLGTIGANVLKDYHITFDLAQGFVEISDPKALDPAKPAGPEAQYVRAYATSKLVWIPVKFRGRFERVVGIGGERFDSIVDEQLCEEFDAPGGAIGSVESAGFDFSTIVPWRPEELPFAHDDGAIGILGINFLTDFRVEVDRVNGWVGLTRTRTRDFPSEERGFFEARASEETEEMQTWLAAHRGSRLAPLAAETLLMWHVDEGAELDVLTDAIKWMHETRPDGLRATRSIDTMRMLTQARLPAAAIVAGRLGVEAGRLDRYPESVHRLHVRLGELLLDTQRNREAWEHLMSAAFGLHEAVGAADQAQVNLLLASYYERMKRYKRAASRYVQAVITPEAGEAAIEGLERVQAKLGRERFGYELVERLISGKVRSMTAPTKFAEDDETRTNRTVLVEHVTNPHLGIKRGENWRAFTEGASMAFQAVLTHFPRERVVMLAYHNDYPRPVGITNGLAQHAAERLGARPVFAINGRKAVRGALEYHQADKAYDALRGRVRQALCDDTEYELTIDGKIDAGRIRGEVHVRGPAHADLRVEILLAEKGVLYPGMGASVVHRMVARAALTPKLEGLPYRPTASASPQMRAPFEAALSEIEARNRAFLDQHEKESQKIATRLSVGMDPEHLVVISVLREATTGLVLQSRQLELAAPGRKPRKAR